MSVIRKIAYSNAVSKFVKGICSLFFDKKYLTGKFFEEKRMGYIWCIQSIFRILKLRR